MGMVLTWNPQRWDFAPGEYDSYVEQTQRVAPSAVRYSWSAGRRQHGVVIGERAFMLRQGADRRGIVGSGVVASEPYGAPHWDGSGRETLFVDVDWDRFVDVDDRVPTEALLERVPSVPWNYLFASGAPLSDSAVRAVESLWSGTDRAAGAQPTADAANEADPAFSAEVDEDAIDLLRRLLGVPLATIRGRLNRIISVSPPNVIVATEQSPQGRPIPIQEVQEALDVLRAQGSVVIDPSTIGHRSSFIGAVLLTLPGGRIYGSPPVFTLAAFGDSRRGSIESGLDDHVVTFEGELTHLRETGQRGEQAQLRRRLFGSQAEGTCALCGKTFPVRFLFAAHIKPRSVCTDQEKRDLTAIAMPACSFGCDALFEAGYLTVDSSGTIQTSRRADIDGAVSERLKQLEGRVCPAFAPSSRNYFHWHRENRFRG